jgi:hypothetical protein
MVSAGKGNKKHVDVNKTPEKKELKSNIVWSKRTRKVPLRYLY